MTDSDLVEQSRRLVEGRVRVLGAAGHRVEQQLDGASAAELVRRLASTPRPDKPAVGLLLARAVLDDALRIGSPSAWTKFLFRFAAHLKGSIDQPGLSAPERRCLAIAAKEAFVLLPTASRDQRAQVDAVARRLAGPAPSELDWERALGSTHDEVRTALRRIAQELTASDRTPISQANRSVTPDHVQVTVNRQPMPSWLVLDFTGTPDELVAATANWQPAGDSAGTAADVALAWRAFQDGDFGRARTHVSGYLTRLGRSWGPTSSTDVLRTWNWLRLVSELATIEGNTALDTRRSSASACEYAAMCFPDDDDLRDDLLTAALGDFAAGDVASTRAWCAYTARIVAAIGHEAALDGYTNVQKAALRMAWAAQFALNPEEARSTVGAVNAIGPRLKGVTQRLYVGARDGTPPLRVLREASHDLMPFLDEAEEGLFHEVLDLAGEADRVVRAETSNHRDLLELVRTLEELRGTVAASGSRLLLDIVAPHLQVLIGTAERATAQLVSTSRPAVVARLGSKKIPFSARVGSTYHVLISLSNNGNAAAENITVRLSQPDVGIDTTARLSSLGAGAEADVDLPVRATQTATGAVELQCDLTWSDSVLQHFSSSQQLAAEDQRAVSWQAHDVNPFSLSSISDPDRLVGRADDLASLDGLLAGRASAAITGHKRVGKTSLTKVLLKQLQQQRGWAGGVLDLGRALGANQSADDLVYALLDEVLGAARDVYPHHVSDLPEIQTDRDGNFARAANRWIRRLARALPVDARVVVAVDDFDELPAHLVEGPQADSLFLFLRSLVDEPWLNLIVVGSEVLPSIIQAQAHKLNQVVPVSVDNFASRESTADLLVSPTSDRLEWSTTALDRAHHLCHGNPYYETLLGQRLWQSMREQERSFVTVTDVDDAVARVAAGAAEGHFMHLWADGASGLEHNSRAAVVSSAVLRSVARCGGAALAPAADDEVVRIAQNWIQTATTGELHQAVARLRGRQVLEAGPTEGTVLLRIPLVGVWLNDAGGRALDQLYAGSAHATATTRMVTDTDLVAISRQLVYRGEHITETRIKAWLSQFGDNYHQYLAFRMLRRMVDGYYTSSKLQTTVLPRLAREVATSSASRQLQREANNQYLKNAYLIDHGVPGDSTQGTLSALAKALKVKKANIVATADLEEKVRGHDAGVVLFLLDDYCGSGTHLSRELDTLLENASKLGDDWTERVHVVVGAGVVAGEGALPRYSGPATVETVAGVVLGDRYRPFAADSGVFETDEERHDAEQMVTSIGRALLPRNPLGFGGEALLTLLEFNCPNNVAPVFWKSGPVAGTSWMPLFERAV
ncbi:phosphoribosyltransferase-like protein [Angustibacter aerolatus]